MLLVSNILFAETNSTMPLCFSFFSFVSVTNSPMSPLLNLFFCPSFLFWGDIFLSAPLGFFFSASLVCLSSLWHLFLNEPNQKYLYINMSRSCLKAIIIGKQPNCVPYYTSKHQFFPYSHSFDVMCCIIMVQCVCVNEGCRKWMSRGDETRFRPRGDSYTGASVLSVCR